MIKVSYGTNLFDNEPWEYVGFAKTQEKAMEIIEDYITFNNLSSAPYRRGFELYDGSLIK